MRRSKKSTQKHKHKNVSVYIGISTCLGVCMSASPHVATQIIPGRRRCPVESSELLTDPGRLLYGAYSRGMLGTAGTAREPDPNVGVRGSVYAERSNSSEKCDSRRSGWRNLTGGGGEMRRA